MLSSLFLTQIDHRESEMHPFREKTEPYAILQSKHSQKLDI